MQIISYILDKDKQYLLDEYIKDNPKDFSTNRKKIGAITNIINGLLRYYKINLEVKKTNKKQRTSAQNRAYWLWLTQIIERLEKQNISPPDIFGNPMEWTKEVLHHTITHGIIFKEYGKVSTTHLKTDEIELVIDRYTEMFKDIIELPNFPSIEGMLIERNYNE